MLAIYAKVHAGTVLLTGGEPLLVAGIDRIIEIAIKGGAKVDLQTNGVLWASMSANVKGADNIMISLDGFRETHHRIRGNDGFGQIIGLATRDRRIRLSCVIQRNNIDEIEVLARELAKYQIRHTFLLEHFLTEKERQMDEVLLESIGLRLTTQSAEVDFSWRDQWEDVITRIPKKCRSFAAKHIAAYWSEFLPDLMCKKLNERSLRISPWGTYYFCEHIGLEFGSALDRVPEEVVASREFQAFVVFMRENRLHVCKRCCKSR